MRKITSLVFNKTGNITKLDIGVTLIKTVNENYTEDEVLRLASALEQSSEHPIAVGIIRKVTEDNVAIPKVENFNSITGKGVEADVEGKEVKVVSPGYLRDENIDRKSVV